MKYRLNFGQHTINEQTYQAGDIIETEVPLDRSVPLYDVDQQLWKFTALPDDPTPPPTYRRKS